MTLKMASAQVDETSVDANKNSSFQNYTNPDDHTRQTHWRSYLTKQIFLNRSLLQKNNMFLPI